MTAHELVQSLGARLGVPGWNIDERGACALSFPDGLRMELRFVAGTSAMCFIATLGALVAIHREEAVVGLLMANRFFSEQGEPWFALDRAAGIVHFCRTLSFHNQTADVVVEDLGRLVNAARGFRQVLLQRQQVV